MQKQIDRAKKWSIDRNINALIFSKEDLYKNLMEESLEPIEHIEKHGIKDLWKENLDSLLDRFVYIVVDSTKQDFYLKNHELMIKHYYDAIQDFCWIWNLDMDIIFDEMFKEIESRVQCPIQQAGGSEAIIRDGKWKKDKSKPTYKAKYEKAIKDV